jgi:3-oxoacyl-[acyl-carrier protein] reductase
MGFLDGQAGIVTGAAVGLGRYYARALAQEGCDVVICDIRPEVDAVGRELDALGVRAVALHADVSKPDDVLRVVNTSLERFGRIDVLINNAGIWRGSTATDDLDRTLATYDEVVGTNLKGVYMFGRAVIPHMIAAGHGGNIINISSDHVHTHPGRPTGGGPGMDLYDASKWGVIGFTTAWAKALRPHNIRVNAMCMGATDSYMLRSFNQFKAPPEVVATWMRPEEVCDLAIQVIREGPGGRTGQNIGTWVGHEVVLQPTPPAKATHIID